MNAVAGFECGQGGGETASVEAARKLVGFAAARADRLGGDLFVNPAWAILLHLFIAGCRPLGIDALARATNLSEAAARRWSSVLDRRGLVEISENPDASGQQRVRLTERACQAIAGLLAGLG